jgi:hypothetical protein
MKIQELLDLVKGGKLASVGEFRSHRLEPVTFQSGAKKGLTSHISISTVEMDGVSHEFREWLPDNQTPSSFKSVWAKGQRVAVVFALGHVMDKFGKQLGFRLQPTFASLEA